MDQATSSLAQLSLKKTAKFPARPKTPARLGKEVKLIVNLFKLSYNAKCPIKKYHVSMIPPPRVPKPGDKTPKTSGDASAPLANTEDTKKIPQKISRDLVKKALMCLSKSRPELKHLESKYVYDGKATIYTIVDLFGANASKTNNWFEAQIPHEELTIVDQRMVMVSSDYTVKIGYQQIAGTNINLGLLESYCQGKAFAIEDIQPAIQALNVIINYNMVLSGRYVCIGNNMFSPDPKKDFDLGNGIKLNTGFYLSARPAKCGMLLNVANAVAAFYDECNLVDLLCQRVASKRFRREGERIDAKTAFMEAQNDKTIWDQFEKDIRQKQVEARHRAYPGSDPSVKHYRKVRVLELTRIDAQQLKFKEVNHETKAVTETSVEQYLKRMYKYTLKYPKLFCVKVGSPQKFHHLPMEVCWLIEKQACRRKFDPKETAEIIKKTATKPDVHFDKIKRNAADISNSGQNIYATFGINIGVEPLPVKGRELEPTSLMGNKLIKPFDGAYTIRNGIQFFNPVSVTTWMLALCAHDTNRPDRDIRDQNEKACDTFLRNYMNGARSLGIAIPEPVKNNRIIPSTCWKDDSFWKQKFFPFLENNRCQYVLIILPEQAQPSLYQTIKFLEAESAQKLKGKFIKTQCLKFANFKKGIGFGRAPDLSLVTNLWLKANEKLGGNNFTLKASATPGVFDSNNLYLGIDVSHPAPGDALCRSVVAAVGMWNITGKVGYHTVLKVQETRSESSAQQITIEHVDKADEMLASILESYRAAKKSYPTHILILRDGVSEGQFNIVHNVELNKILTYIGKLPGPKPKVTYVVVQKRHKIRFRLAQRSERDRDDNIHPGTVVDQDIIHPTDHDFYLASHKAIQGTSRPAHYYALHDEKNYSQDNLQEISHALCYMSPRCNRAISIPAPIYLADLAAERGRNLVIAWASRVTSKKQGSRENIKDLNNFFSNLPSEYLNELFYN